MRADQVDLSVQLAGLSLRNPVMTASGTFGFGAEYEGLVRLGGLGAMVVKATTLEPRAGNRPPRVAETPAGMLNAIGLQNPGLETVLAEKLPKAASYGVPVIVNISGQSVGEFAQLAEALSASPYVAALEVNISCPNVACEGMFFGTDAGLTEELVAAVKARATKPVIVKLSPNVTDIAEIAKGAQAGGADALSLINTLLGMAIDVERRRPRLGNITGGLSGPAVRPVAVRMVWQVAQAVDLPIIGMGGITCAEDALEFILAGATAVAVGTWNFVDYAACDHVIAGLRDYCVRHEVARVADLVGALQTGR
jgi:dihydroorotate dehydrogenase (NAD+) catalytic subunit